MPNIKSAKKRVLVNAKKNSQNRASMSEVKSVVKKFNNAIDINNFEEAEKQLPVVFSALDSAVAKGLIHKNNAANKKSALSKKLSDVKSGKIVIAIKKDNKTIAAEKAKQAQETREQAKNEFLKIAAEKKAAKLESEKAKLAAANAKPAKSKKAAEEKPAKEEKAAKKETAKAKADVKEEKPAKKAAAKTKEPKPAEVKTEE